MNRYAESIDYSENCKKAIEQHLNIDKTKQLSEYRYNGYDEDKQDEFDKLMTTYAISTHLLGKNLANLKYVKESKVFLTQAQYVASNMLSKPKPDLQIAINNDIANLQKSYKALFNEKKSAQQSLQEAESSLINIKNTLANTSYNQQADMQEQKALYGTISNGPPVKMIPKDDGKKKKKKGQQQPKDEDEDENVFGYVKKFQEEKRKKEERALEDYHRRQGQDFGDKQKEFMEKQQMLKFNNPLQIIEEKPPSKYNASGKVAKDDKEDSQSQNIKPIKNQKNTSEQKQSEAATPGKKGGKSVENRFRPAQELEAEKKEMLAKKAEMSQRIKKASMNLAAEGAELDRKGIKYDGEKGKKHFFTRRKENIGKVNQRLGFVTNDEEDSEDDEELERKYNSPTREEQLKLSQSSSTLPPIKGYKTGDLNLVQGEQFQSKYEGYQSDLSKKSKELFNKKDPSQKRLIKQIGGNYVKHKPSSLKKYDSSSEEEEGEEEQKQPIKDIPVYKPPTKNNQSTKSLDWRDDIKGGSSSDEPLPDAKGISKKLADQNVPEDPIKKLSIVDGDQTQYEQYVKKQEQMDAIMQGQQNDILTQGGINATNLVKPPRAQSTKRVAEPQDSSKDLKSKIKGKTGKDLGMTPKGSPRRLGKEEEKKLRDQSESQQQSKPSSRGRAGDRGKSSGQKPRQNSSTKLIKKEDSKQATYKSPGQKRKKANPDDPWGGPDEEEEEAKAITRQQREDRLAALSQPKARNYVLVQNSDEEDDDLEEETGDSKTQSVRDRLEKGKEIKFEEYVDRDVPYIKNQTHGLAEGQTGGRQFNTRSNNKSGMFSQYDKDGNLIKPDKVQEDVKSKTPGGPVKQIMVDKKGRKIPQSQLNKNAKTPGPGKKSNLKPKAKGQYDEDDDDDQYVDAFNPDMPDFLRGANQRRPTVKGGKGNVMEQIQKDLQNAMSKKGGAKNRINGLANILKTLGGVGGGKGNLSIQELREVERLEATMIQKMVRGYFTRKWYLNYMMRKKLGVPFSGLEFASNPFLRLFNRPNQKLHQNALVQPQTVEVVKEQNQYRNLLRKDVKHGKLEEEEKRKKKMYSMANLGDNAGTNLDGVVVALPGDEVMTASMKQPIRRIPKGATPAQLLNNLQKDFVAQGLDAYTQFKRLGAGIEHDEDGNEIVKGTQFGEKKDDEILEVAISRIPKWKPSNAPGFLETEELDQYIEKTNKIKVAKNKLAELNIDHLDEFGQDIRKPMKQNFTSSYAAFASLHGALKQVDQYGKKKFAEIMEEEEDVEDQDIQALLKKKRKTDEDEDFFPIEGYQDFSREPIVFFKKIGDHLIKWQVIVGIAYRDKGKYFIPVKILGEPMKSRNAIVEYLMNLEMIKISKTIEKNFEFETIWPFILYLFNNWVRHQVRMMGLMEQRPELRGKFDQPKENLYEVQELDPDLKTAAQYDDMLNFSSEIEFDDRFDLEKYQEEKNPDHLLDRSVPEDKRMKPLQQMRENKDQMFSAYRKKIAMYENLVQMDEDEEKIDIDEKGKQKKRVRIQLEDVFEPIEIRKQNPFEFFLKMHFISLPQLGGGQFKLMKNLQAQGYIERYTREGLQKDSIALMNEERRKRKNLPPLSTIDYNCIDRASLKLKFIVDCLYMRRQMNGWALVPRDVKEALLAKEWHLRKFKFIETASKQANVSVDILKVWGQSIHFPKLFNENSVQIEQSLKKIQEYKNRNQITITDPNSLQVSQEHINFGDQIINNSSFLEDDQVKIISNLRSKEFGKNTLSPQMTKKQTKQLKAIEEEHEDKQDAIGKLMDKQKTKMEVDDYLREDEILEQGTLLIEENSYISTFIYKKISSNYENMRYLLDERIKRFNRDYDDNEDYETAFKKGRIDKKTFMSKKMEKMQSRRCDFISLNEKIITYDKENHGQIRELEKLDIEQEKHNKEVTVYRSYAEIKVCSKISTTNWDDSFNITWETLKKFFLKFNIKWDPEDFMKRRRFSAKERFFFYNFFASCLFIYDCRVMVDLSKFDFEAFKFDYIYLQLEEIERKKRENKLAFYYDDLIKKDFDESTYDYPIFPFYEDPKFVEELIIINEGNVYSDYQQKGEDKAGQSVSTQIVEMKRKPDLLIDEETKHLLEDPNNMFNLTLTHFDPSDGLYLGKILLANKENYKNTYNLRIDYYVKGYTPTILIKAFNCIYYDIYALELTHRQTIKDIIRICNQAQMKMVINQLQSMIQISRKLNGKCITLNFRRRKHKAVNLGQQYTNMLICNENLLRQIQNESYRQFQGIVFFDNLGGRMLVTVTEFDIDIEQMKMNMQELQMIHGNKHLSVDEKNKLAERGISKNLMHAKKTFQLLKVWKINLFNIFRSAHYDAVISYQDLVNYFESDIFKFYELHPNMIKPNLVSLLSEQIKNIYLYRTKLGTIIYWKLPHYKRPVDDKGMQMDVPPEHLYKLKLLQVYLKLQKKIDEQNKEEDLNQLPFSLDQLKAKRQQRQPPSLSLRNKLIFEKELPIYPLNDTRILRLTASDSKLIVQLPKIFKFVGTLSYCLISVTLYPIMESWIWQIYFLKTQRTFSVTFYPSDLFNMDGDILNYTSVTKAVTPEVGLWTEIIQRCQLEQNPTGDIILTIDQYREPLREILYQDHVYNENAADIFFMEVVVKNQSNYVTDVKHSFIPIDLHSDDVYEYTVSLRAYSLTRNVWIKDYQPLTEILRILKKENYITDEVRLFYYSMFRDAAALLSHKIVFSNEAKTSEVRRRKLTYDIKTIIGNKDQFQKLQEEKRDDPLPDKKMVAERYQQKEIQEGENIIQKEGLKTEWRNIIDLNKIIYQIIISKNPHQLCSIIYNDVRDVFEYKIYRSGDGNTFSKIIPAYEIAKTCAPQYQQLLKNGMQNHLGERIAKYYMNTMIVASLMSYYNIKQ